jgi:hypothetical protein
MKSIVLKLLPVIFATVLVSYTKPSPRFLYYWFSYSNGFLVPLNGLDVPVPYAPYGCEDEGDYICTRAYLPLDTELYLDGYILKRRPKYGCIFQIQRLKDNP